MRNWDPRLTLRHYHQVRRNGRFNAAPPMVLAGGFMLLSLIGALLLWLPFSVNAPISPLTALFSAVSAVTITGLSTVDISVTYTPVGQAILITLVQIGGLGFVTFSIVAALALGKRISLQHQALAQEAFNQTSVATVRQTAFAIIKITLVLELIGIVWFTLYWWQESSLLSALGHGIFHTLAAFNNAGISLTATHLSNYVSDPVVILGTTALIILGGIGFPVLNDIRQKKSWKSLSPYSKIVLIGTAIMNLIGFVMIWLFEYDNPFTLGPLDIGGQALGAWLQNVTTRTAGFNSVDIASLEDSTTLLMMLYMFIGGGSLSLASGIKIGTFIVLMAAAYSYIFQRPQVVLLKRAISADTVQKSLALLLITATLIFSATLIMTMIEDAPFISVLFEVVSAVSTTGLSRDLTSTLSWPSQFLVILLMFIGRLGPLTLIYSLSTQHRGRVRYPETSFQIG
ncbi:TrkH family potassium uptake protein [Pusillimonas sp. NJUB218]|uniref:TrkH family potassium uptake protein n=1 Tax=Pusillimonas sp. NJUB218 TaxID=2023230 RepID=UPI000F4B12C2|nr:potassium transporter TrkG [Pusillimonas sp. NJUB218]ROT44438.1 potassium transporter [Pusillimonas sp. NJUB218]